MLTAKLKKSQGRIIKSIEAMSDEYKSLCESCEPNVTQEKGLLVSDEQSFTSLKKFLSNIASKVTIRELESSEKWIEATDGRVRDVIESFFSNLNEVWENTPTGAWAVVGLQRRQEKIQNHLTALLIEYGVDTEAQKVRQAVAGAACMIDYVGMTGAMPTTNVDERSDYNKRIRGVEAKSTGIFFNTVGFSVCPKKEASVKALLTSAEVRHPIYELAQGEETVFYQGAESVECIIAENAGLSPLQHFSHLTDSLDRAKVQYDNIKTLLACMPMTDQDSNATRAMHHMLKVIVEDMLIELTPTVTIQGTLQQSRTICAMRKKAYLSGCEAEEEVYTKILEQALEEDDETPLTNAAWWQTCSQKIFTPHALMALLLQNSKKLDVNELLGSIERISPVTGEVSGVCWLTMASMLAIVEGISAQATQSMRLGKKDSVSIQKQQTRALQQLCVDVYLSPKYVAKSGLTYQEVFASIVDSGKSIKVYQDLFDGENGFQSAYNAFSSSLTLHNESVEHMKENLKLIVLEAPEKDDAVLQAVGDIIKVTKQWSSDRVAQTSVSKAVQVQSTVERELHADDRVEIGLMSRDSQKSGVTRERSKPVSSSLTPRVPEVEKIQIENQAGTTIPVVKIVYKNSDIHNKLEGLQTVLQQSYNKNVWNRWGEANLWSIPNLAAGAACLLCVTLAGLSWMAGDIAGLALNTATAIAVSWYSYNAYRSAVTKLQEIPTTYLDKLSKQGMIIGEVDHKNWAWNKPCQTQAKSGFMKGFLGYAAILTPCLLVIVLILKAKGWLAIGSLGLRTLAGVSGVMPIQATSFTKHIGKMSRVLAGSNLARNAGSNLTLR